jgi:hypothetical protein
MNCPGRHDEEEMRVSSPASAEITMRVWAGGAPSGCSGVWRACRVDAEAVSDG